MTEFPPSLTKHSPQWFVVVALIVAGDLAGMLATFMPMKVVLILASGDVPGFFPDFLIDGRAVFASLVLLLVAGLFGVMAWLSGVVIARMDRGPVQWAGNSGQLSDWKSESFEEAKKSIFDYIERWYNPHRKHSTLGYMSPKKKYLLLTQATS